MDSKPLSIEVIDDQMAEVLRAKTPAQKVAMTCDANRTARELAAAGARYLHPDWDEDRIHGEVLRRVCGGSK